jgi:hypothetical protein
MAGRHEGSQTGALGLYTDLYELRMVDSYLREQMTAPATFSLFIRPTAERPWFVAHGMHRVTELIDAYRFGDTELAYLAEQGFGEPVLAYLSALEPSGEIRAVEEGTVVLAQEPLLEVTAQPAQPPVCGSPWPGSANELHRYAQLQQRLAPLFRRVVFRGSKDDIKQIAVDGTTYGELFGFVARGLVAEDRGYRGAELMPLRHIGWEDSGIGGLGPFFVSRAEALAFGAADRRRLLLLVDLGDWTEYAEGYAVLALYDISASPELLDAAEVNFNRHVGFGSPARLSSSSGLDLFVVNSSHSNSHQGYLFTALLMVEADRLELIDTIFTLSQHSCAGEWRQTPEVAFGAGEAGREPIVATVIVETTPWDEDCGDDAPRLEQSRREVSVIYHFDPASSRYVAESDALKRLEVETEDRF